MKALRILALGASLAAHAEGPLAGARLEPGVPEQLEALQPGAFDLVLIDADAWEAPQLAAAVKALSGLKVCPPVLLVGSSLPAGLVRNLLRLGCSDVLEAPFQSEQLMSAIQGLLADAAHIPASTSGQARCWAVTGAVGGAGATTLAVEIANALGARTGKPRSACLIDLNLADGASAAYLGVQPAMRLGEAGHAAERMDASMLEAFVTPVSPRLDLIAGVRDPTGFDAGREAVLRQLEVACERYEWVILDLPRHRRTWTLEAISGCDEVLVVSELTVPALLAARAYVDEIELATGRSLRPRIVLNRLASRVFGPAPSLAEAERALQHKAEAGISSDWEAAAASANLGGPIAHHRPKSKIVKDIQGLVERLAVQNPRRDSTPKAA